MVLADMTARGKVWCLMIVLSVSLWWLVICAAQMAVAALMPVLVWIDAGR
jgi:hypothetical protein